MKFILLIKIVNYYNFKKSHKVNMSDAESDPDAGTPLPETTVPAAVVILNKTYSQVPLIAISVFWLFIGTFVPLLISKNNPNKG